MNSAQVSQAVQLITLVINFLSFISLKILNNWMSIDKIEIVNWFMNRDTMSYVLMMIDCTKEFVLIVNEGQPKIR